MSVFGVILVCIFSHWTEYRDIRSISQYSVWIRRNTDQNNSEYGHISRSDYKRNFCMNTPLLTFNAVDNLIIVDNSCLFTRPPFKQIFVTDKSLLQVYSKTLLETLFHKFGFYTMFLQYNYNFVIQKLVSIEIYVKYLYNLTYWAKYWFLNQCNIADLSCGCKNIGPLSNVSW